MVEICKILVLFLKIKVIQLNFMILLKVIINVGELKNELSKFKLILYS